MMYCWISKVMLLALGKALMAYDAASGTVLLFVFVFAWMSVQKNKSNERQQRQTTTTKALQW